MKLLLDTHAFLWFILDEPKLTALASDLISDSNNEVLVSPASYWEIAIKIQLGKYSLPQPFASFIETQITSNAFSVLHITPVTVHTQERGTDPYSRAVDFSEGPA